MLKWFVCPDGRMCEVNQCLKTRGCRLGARCLPWAYLKYVGARRPWTGTPSVTQLIKGTCQAYLEITTDYAVRPEEEVFRVLGTMTHENLAFLAALHPDKFVEENLTLDGITGQADEYDTEDGIKILTDYKVVGSAAVARVLGIAYRIVESDEVYRRKTITNRAVMLPGERKHTKEFYSDPSRRNCWEYDIQLNMYRIMRESQGQGVDKMRLVLQVRDWGQRDAVARGVTKKIYSVAVPRLSDSMVKNYFRKKRDDLLGFLKSKSLPWVCSSQETWGGKRCREYCNVRGNCPYITKCAGGNLNADVGANVPG